MSKRRTFVILTLGVIGLVAAFILKMSPSQDATRPSIVSTDLGFSELPDGRGGINVEAITYTEAMGFDRARSLAVFEETVYPLARAYCDGCHSTQNESGDCDQAAARMLEAVTAWADAVADMLPAVPRGVPESTQFSDDEILAWIEADRATIADADQEFIQYTSFHEFQNAGVTAQDLNHARVGLSKALNGTARWASDIVNPRDVNGKGILYRFDIRDYWGHTLIDTSDPEFQLFYGGSDDDLAFAESKVDLNGNPIAYGVLAEMVHELKPEVTPDEKFARLVWARVLKGNANGAADGETLPPNIDGFIGDRVVGPHGQDMVRPEDLRYAEAGQLAYTLTRPDVYNAIMAIPGYSHELERELGVDKSRGMDSYDYMVMYEAITIDSRFMWRAQTPAGYYWKTFDVFTQGSDDIDQAYGEGDVTYPLWANPIPKFISNQGETTPEDLSYVATLPLGAFDFDVNGSVGRYTGQDGPQQSAEEVIFSLPNGLQGTVLFGAWNQRRIDAFTLIVRDPRILRQVEGDKTLDNLRGFGREAGVPDHRLNTASSCIGCHVDGMNRSNNDLRDWLDEQDFRNLPSGEFGVDGWINDAETVQRVRELYPPSSEMRHRIENDRRIFLTAMAKIKDEMVLGVDKNVYVEPAIWTIEWTRNFYGYPVTRSN